ncbi:VanZ family protein [Williamsia muralis]|uniref:VanZ family protein n=1 Tax=Williamsia marianensis TaxID=85044 RepID=UPI003F1467AF
MTNLRRRRPIIGLLLVYIAVIGFVTLTPRDDSRGSPLADTVLEYLDRHEATAWITFTVLERSANVFLFVPLGVLLAATLGRRHWISVVGFGILYSVVIESCQAMFLPGRVADPVDVAMNGLGTAIGAILHSVITGNYQARTSRAQAIRREPLADNYHRRQL